MTLSQLQAFVGNAIRVSPNLQNVWVQAELIDVRGGGGHWYMDLIEKDSAGNTRARLRAMMWNGTQQLLRQKFYNATGRDIGNNLKVLVRGSVTHHGLYGLSFTISDIDPSYTLGDLERLRREILERLAREGVLNCNKSVAVPFPPQRIAVISAPGAAGYGDFMNQIEHNPDGFAIYTCLFPSLMQGERTAASVMNALDLVQNAAKMFDAVVIIRGGGATTDLNGFDNYELARRVATFPLPVIVGIGHERDRTVLDEIACVRCKTPTAVAAWIIDAMRLAYNRATEAVRRIADFAAASLKGENIRLTHVAQSLPVLAKGALMRQQMRLNELTSALPACIGSRVTAERLNLARISANLDRVSSAIVGDARAKLAQYALMIRNGAESLTQKESLRLDHLEHALRLLSPQNTLRRGYSITRVDGHALTSIAGISAGQRITTILPDGSITSSVTETEPAKE